MNVNTEQPENGVSFDEFANADFFDRTEHRASMAAGKIADMVASSRRQSQDIAEFARDMRDQIRASETSRLQVEEENRKLTKRLDDTLMELEVFKSNYRRLSQGFANLIRSLEETVENGAGLPERLGVSERIDAMLLHNELRTAASADRFQPPHRVSSAAERFFGHPPRQDDRREGMYASREPRQTHDQYQR